MVAWSHRAKAKQLNERPTGLLFFKEGTVRRKKTTNGNFRHVGGGLPSTESPHHRTAPQRLGVPGAAGAVGMPRAPPSDESGTILSIYHLSLQPFFPCDFRTTEAKEKEGERPFPDNAPFFLNSFC